jgi:hypothetical protein
MIGDGAACVDSTQALGRAARRHKGDTLPAWIVGKGVQMRFAAPFDPRLARVLRRLPLDVATAETCRRLGRAAEGFGLARPGYASVRVHVAAERLRRAERDAALEVGARVAFTRSVVPTADGVEAEYRRAVGRRLERPRR